MLRKAFLGIVPEQSGRARGAGPDERLLSEITEEGLLVGF